MNGIRRMLSGWLVFCIIIAMLPLPIWAEEAELEENAAVNTEHNETVAEETIAQFADEEHIPDDFLMTDETDADATEQTGLEVRENASAAVASALSDWYVTGYFNMVPLWGITQGRIFMLLPEYETYLPAHRDEPAELPWGFSRGSDAPWRDFSAEIKAAVISDGIHQIGDYAFAEDPDNVWYHYNRLREVTVGANVSKIGKYAFRNVRDDGLNTIIFRGDAPQIAPDAFTGVVATAYYPLGNPTWTADVMQDYGGKITWISAGRETQVSVICYANLMEPKESEEKFVLCPDVTIQVGGHTYQTDSNGQATIAGRIGQTVTFDKDGYAPRKVLMETLELNNKIYLQKESDHPIIHALWMDDTDLIHTEVDLEYASEEEITIIPDIDWGIGGEGQIKLYQEGKTIALQEGDNSLAIALAFDINKNIYIVASNAMGLSSQKVLKIKKNDLDGFNFSLIDVLKFTITETAPPIFAGMEINLDVYSPVPVEVAEIDGKIYAAIGYQNGAQWKDGEKEVKSFSNSVKSLTKSLDNLSEEIDRYKTCRDVMTAFGSKLAVMKGSFGRECNFSIMGYAEGYRDTFGEFVLTSAGGVIVVHGAAAYTQPFVLGPVPMFFEIGFSVDLEAKMNLYLNNQIREFTPDLNILGVVALNGGVGVGAAEVLAVSGGLAGKLNHTLNITQGSISYYRLQAALNWYVKMKLVAATFTGGDTIKDAVWIEYPGPEEFSTALSRTVDYYDTTQYSMDDLSYLAEGSSFMGEGMATYSLRNRSNVPFVSNAYDGADPQVAAFSDGTRLAVWIGYTEGRSGADALNLHYSFYDGSWSQPWIVEADGTMDAYPDLKVIDDVAYLVWQDASGSIGSSATLDDIAGLMEISGAVFDKTTQSFICKSITSGSGMLNLQPKLCGDANAVYVVWQRNGENDWFGQNHANSLLYSRIANGNWGNAGTLYSGLSALLGFDVTCINGAVSVAYSMDMDSNLNTDEDVEIYRDGTVVTDNNWLDSGVCFSGKELYWYSGGRLMKNGDSVMPEGVFIGSDRFRIVNENGVHALVYAQEDGLASVLYAAYYDPGSGSWGNPVVLFSAGTSISAFSASATADGEISVLIQSQEVSGEFDGTDPYGTVSLIWYNAPMGCNIRLDDVRYYNENYVADKDMPIYLTVSNTGELTVQKLLVELLDETGTVVQSKYYDRQLLSGESRELEFLYRVGEIIQGKELTVRVTAADIQEMNMEDNSSQVIFAWNDLAVENIRWGRLNNKQAVIHASIVNRGYETQSNIIVKLLKDAPYGTVVSTIMLAELESFAMKNVSFTVDASVESVYYVSVEHRESDGNYANDADFVKIGKKGDLTGDGMVTETDAIYLIWHTLFPKVYPLDTHMADFNGDGDITAEDALPLLWKALFPGYQI